MWNVARAMRKLDELCDRAERIEEKLETLEDIQMDMNRLKAAVKKVEDVGDATVTLLQRVADELRNIKDDPAEIEELASRLEMQAEEMGAAVAANTPADTTNAGGGEDTVSGEDTTGSGTGEDTTESGQV